MLITNILGKIIKEVAKRNQERPDVKTADPVVFEDLNKKFETFEKEEEAAPVNRSRADMYKGMAERLKQAQIENEASEEVETADRSVYDEMLAEIERLKHQVDMQGERDLGVPEVAIPDVSISDISIPETSNVGGQAVTNSMGGSLSVRENPDMGAKKFEIRVPHKSLVNIISYSDNSIILDGKRSRFVYIDYEGQRGWILENYLNFN